MPIIGRAIRPLFIKKPIFLIKDGVVQSGFSFTMSAKAYNSSYTANSGTTHSWTEGNGSSTPFATMSASYNSSYATSWLLLSNNIKSYVDAGYNTLVFRIRRTVRANSGTTRSDIGTYSGTATYISSNMKDHVTVTNVVEETFRDVAISLTSSSTSPSTLYVAMALAIPTTYPYTGSGGYRNIVQHIYLEKR